jgi:hypothetical protein
VPLSYGWTGERIVLATDSTMVTARNLVSSGKARLGTGHTRDVVMIDAELETVHPVGEAPDSVSGPFVGQSDWDPQTQGDPYVFLVLRPVRIQAWREGNEIAGRTLMRDGAWLGAEASDRQPGRAAEAKRRRRARRRGEQPGCERSPSDSGDLEHALVEAVHRDGTERGQRLVLVLEDVRVRLVCPVGLVAKIVESVPIEALAGDGVHPQCHCCGHGTSFGTRLVAS